MRRGLMIIFLCFVLCIPVSAKEPAKYVALTFDDGPSGQITRRLLEGLAQRDVRATFFLCGYRLELYGDLAGEIRRQGHEVGLHGFSHDSMADMGPEELRRELRDTAALLPEGCVVSLMRPPGGNGGKILETVTREANLSVISWSVDPRDWATDDASEILHRLLEQTGDGDVILMHDMTDSSVDAALALVDELTDRGYKFLTVSQLAMLRLCQLRPGRSYESFPLTSGTES